MKLSSLQAEALTKDLDIIVKTNRGVDLNLDIRDVSVFDISGG